MGKESTGLVYLDEDAQVRKLAAKARKFQSRGKERLANKALSKIDRVKDRNKEKVDRKKARLSRNKEIQKKNERIRQMNKKKGKAREEVTMADIGNLPRDVVRNKVRRKKHASSKMPKQPWEFNKFMEKYRVIKNIQERLSNL